MMDLQEETGDEEAQGMPGTSPHDPLTYDPTQGAGTPTWQMSVRANMERNAQERRN